MSLSLILLVLFTISCWIFLWFMIAQPQRWGAFVEKENEFWVARRLISPKLANHIKQFERGLGMKVLVAVAAIGGSIFSILLWNIR